MRERVRKFFAFLAERAFDEGEKIADVADFWLVVGFDFDDCGINFWLWEKAAAAHVADDGRFAKSFDLKT